MATADVTTVLDPPGDADITLGALRAAPGLAGLPALPRELRELRFDRGRSARVHNAVMEEHFTAIRACTGAAAALADGRIPASGGIAVFRCSVAHSAAAPIANPSQPSHSVNFYELLPTLAGAPFEPGTPLPPGVWRIDWTCPLYPEAHGGPAEGAFHIAVGPDVPADLLPEAWARNRLGAIPGAPGNLIVAALAQNRLVAALRSLSGYRDRAEQSACAAMKGFVATKAVRVRNAQPTVFDHDDALQEGLARLIVVMRRFAARNRPRACWTVAAGLVLERDLPRAADKVSHLSSNVAHSSAHARSIEPGPPFGEPPGRLTAATERPDCSNPTSSFSRTRTLAPRSASSVAVRSPMRPPPTTTTSDIAHRYTASVVKPSATAGTSPSFRTVCACDDGHTAHSEASSG